MNPIRRYRLARGMTLAALAKRACVSATTIQQWERGRHPAARHIPWLAQALEVEAVVLVGELDEWQQHARRAVTN